VFVRVSLLGIELLTIDARIVIASVDTYLRFAAAVGRLDLSRTETHTLGDLLEGASRAGSKGKVKGAVDAVGEKVSEKVSGLTPEREAQYSGNRGHNGHERS
jgi:hypothetical protein